jgi:glycosyltransferase involved in cell wall biosynthesis
LRLGIYTDLVYHSDEHGLSADRAFVLFVTSLQEHVEKLVLFGRLDPAPGRSPHAVPTEGVRFVALPHYPRVTDVGKLLRAYRGSCQTFSDELDGLDAVWLFGPHPLALAFARIARRGGKSVFLGVRQDFPQYVALRLPSRRWAWALPVAQLLEAAWQRLARSAPTVVVGEDLGRKYRHGPAPVLVTGFSLIRAAEVVPLEAALSRSWEGELRLLSVGRVDPEKNPLLLLEILSRLRARDPRWRLTIVGTGSLKDRLERRATELGLAGAIALLGYVPVGPELWDVYRTSLAFLHVSLTEGLPQVLFEAQAAGLPVVATDVGGVGAALAGGATGLLVPPSDAPAAVEALERLRLDRDLREHLIRAGLDAVAHETLEAQVERVAEFFRASLPVKL